MFYYKSCRKLPLAFIAITGFCAAILGANTSCTQKRMVNNQTAGKDDPEQGYNLKKAEELLKSPDPDSQRLGISLVYDQELEELFPACADLLLIPDERTRECLIKLFSDKGIPGLNVTNAQQYLGYSQKLDQQIAMYCHSQFGDQALPLVRQVAFYWYEPTTKNRSRGGIQTRKLIEILRDANKPDLDAQLIELARKSITANQRLRNLLLLDMLSPDAPTDIIDELLQSESKACLFHAALLIHELGLDQFGDKLSQLAKTCDPPNVFLVRPLVEFEHPDAWEATVRLLESDAFNPYAKRISFFEPARAYYFGVQLATLKHSHGTEIHEMLRAELAGLMRRWIVVALTASIAFEPDNGDLELLLEIARKEDAPRAAQILAAVALSRMGIPECIPELKRLMRYCLKTKCESPKPTLASGHTPIRRIRSDTHSQKAESCTPREFIFHRQLNIEEVQAEIYPEKKARVLYSYKLFEPGFSKSPKEHRSLAAALNRMGDDSIVPELVEGLVTPDKTWNFDAYYLLIQMKGVEGYRLAKPHVSSLNPNMLRLWTYAPNCFFDLELSRNEALELLTYDTKNLTDEAVLILKYNIEEAANPLVNLFAECTGRQAYLRPVIVDTLCRLGDLRGLDLALEDPELFLHVAKHLHQPPVPVINVEGFKLNREQNARTLMKWYSKNRDNLIWNKTLKKFALPDNWHNQHTAQI